MSEPLISQDEFGTDLFLAIKAQAGSLQAFKTAGLYREKGLTALADEYEQRGMVLQKDLERLFKRNTISLEETKRILAIS